MSPLCIRSPERNCCQVETCHRGLSFCRAPLYRSGHCGTLTGTRLQLPLFSATSDPGGGCAPTLPGQPLSSVPWTMNHALVAII